MTRVCLDGMDVEVFSFLGAQKPTSRALLFIRCRVGEKVLQWDR